MKSHKKLLSLILAMSTLFCCFANLSVMASDIDVSDYTYVVDDMAFYNSNQPLYSLEGANAVSVEVTEQGVWFGTSTVIIAAYSADGSLISKNSTSQSFYFGKTDVIKLPLNIPEGKTVSEVRAFVWDSFSAMTPLSNVLSSENNMTLMPRYDYHEETRFAVVTEAGYDDEVDEETGDIIYTIKAMYEDVDTLVVSDKVSTTKLEALKPADVIYFKRNANYQITDFEVIFSFDGNVPTQAELAKMSLVANNTNYENLNGITIPGKSGTDGFFDKFTTDWNSNRLDSIKYIYGPILEKGDGYITFGKTNAKNKTDIYSDISEFWFSSDIRVYTYDYSIKGAKYRFENQFSDTSAIYPTSLLEQNMDDFDIVDWNKTVDGALVNQETVTFAFAIVVNDEVQDIFAFLPK